MNFKATNVRQPCFGYLLDQAHVSARRKGLLLYVPDSGISMSGNKMLLYVSPFPPSSFSPLHFLVKISFIRSHESCHLKRGGKPTHAEQSLLLQKDLLITFCQHFSILCSGPDYHTCIFIWRNNTSGIVSCIFVLMAKLKLFPSACSYLGCVNSTLSADVLWMEGLLHLDEKEQASKHKIIAVQLGKTIWEWV